MAELSLFQKFTLETLVWVDKFCKEHGITYYLIGGTMLGAARHSGFIPWDDDVDIAMPRKEYNRFMVLVKDKLPPHKYLQNYSLENYPVHYIKIADDRITIQTPSLTGTNITTGAFLDVFPLDGVPSYRWLQWIHYKRIRFYFQFVNARYRSDKDFRRIRAGDPWLPLKLILRKIVKALPKGVIDIVHARYDKVLSKYDYDKCEMVSNLLGIRKMKEIMRREYFGNGKLVNFEAYQFVGVERPHEYLSRLYGDDYMELPPESQCVSHHNFIIIKMPESESETLERTGSLG